MATVRRRSVASRAASALAAALTLLLVLTMTGTAEDEAASRPDVVLILLDDVDPHDGRLWSDPERTPTLASLFSRSGVSFTSAVSETPLCSPGRAGLLTGRHTAAHGVDGNVAAAFDPRVTLGTELRAAGYHTILVGKYLNQLRTELRPRELRRHARGWHEFEVIYEDNGRYYDYATWSREGLERHGRKPSDHSTIVTRRKLVEHVRDAPTDRPLLAIASVYDLHEPNVPTRRYRHDERCRDIEGWAPPSYDGSVEGKPGFVRTRDRHSRPAWPMQRLCEQMLAVDDLAAALVREQERRGRSHDTLFVLTADNGVAWGIHRLGKRKGVPYATPIPLVFAWPARWGEEPLSIDEVVSNIDVAPTICALAGCDMGPFPDGRSTADGLSLLPLLDGESDRLGRVVVREESGPHYPWAPQFWAIRTTSHHPMGRWHYVEWATGERELYDPLADPWELTNLAVDDEHAGLVATLSQELRQEFDGA